MIEHSAEMKNLIGALRVVQGEIAGVKRDSTNPHFRNRYASLEAVVETIKSPLNEAKLSFTQAPGRIIDGAVEVTTMLMHDSGEWMRSTLHVPLAKTDPQGVGSAITYGCRYALMATLGLPPIDDDAEAAVGRPAQQAQAPRAVPKAEPAPSDAAAYVELAKAAIKGAKTERDLKNWWAAEKPNRDKYKLSQSSGPGLDLIMAYNDRKDEFTNGANLLMAG
jgi:hypothetical protein